jgi:hypothetical protein
MQVVYHLVIEVCRISVFLISTIIAFIKLNVNKKRDGSINESYNILSYCWQVLWD